MFRERESREQAGNKNPFKEIDVGYDQEQEVHGDSLERKGRSTPRDDRNSLGCNSACT